MYGCIRIRGLNIVAGVVVLLALAGCGGGGGTGGVGVSSDTGSGGVVVGGSGGSGGGGSTSGTYSATAVVTSAGVPAAGVTVTLSGGPSVNTSNPANIIASKVTDAQGQAVFSGLIKGMNYCFTAIRNSGGTSQQTVVCSNTGDTTILLKL
jgi:hypothetical protein